MPRPNNLMPGDIMLFYKKGNVFKDFLGAAIQFFSKKKGVHVAIVLDDLQYVEMNPPKPKKYWLMDAPWDHIDVFRVHLTTDESANVPQPAFRNEKNVATLQLSVSTHMNQRYGYLTQILPHAVHGLLGKLPFMGRVFSARKRAKNFYSGLSNRDVCSTWMEERLQDALGVDLWPQFAENWLKPEDVPDSPFVVKIT